MRVRDDAYPSGACLNTFRIAEAKFQAFGGDGLMRGGDADGFLNEGCDFFGVAVNPLPYTIVQGRPREHRSFSPCGLPGEFD